MPSYSVCDLKNAKLKVALSFLFNLFPKTFFNEIRMYTCMIINCSYEGICVQKKTQCSLGCSTFKLTANTNNLL